MKRNRRIKRSRLQRIYVRNRAVVKDNEGVPTEQFGTAFSRDAEVWAASGQRQIEMYGDRITNISNVRIQGQYELENRNGVLYAVFSDGNELSIGDGVCVHVMDTDAPDYRIISITPYRPVRLEIERI